MARTMDNLNRDGLIQRARDLAPMLAAQAREAELARQPTDAVIEAVRDSGIFSLMVPQAMGGQGADLDTFFDVVLELSRGDCSMGWVISFYIEHNLWLLHYSPEVVERVFDGADHVLAPGTLNLSGGRAEKVAGGYQLSGQWPWGTGIVHGTWVLAGAMLQTDADPMPYVFLLPAADVEAVDTWHVAGMCGSGSQDFRIDGVFVPDAYGLPFTALTEVTSGIDKRHVGPLYRTPLVPLLGLAGSLPILGAAQNACQSLGAQLQEKREGRRQTSIPRGDSALRIMGEAGLTIESAELMLRAVLGDIMDLRVDASTGERLQWMARIAHAVFRCREATNAIGAAAGASGNRLDNPVQRALRDVNTASSHIVFDWDSRSADYGRALAGESPAGGLA